MGLIFFLLFGIFLIGKATTTKNEIICHAFGRILTTLYIINPKNQESKHKHTIHTHFLLPNNVLKLRE